MESVPVEGPGIELILERKAFKRSFQYFIKWEGYHDESNTWETREDLISDGFLQQVEAFDREIDDHENGEAEETQPRSARRARSKTPSRKVSSPSKSEKDSHSEIEEEEEEEKEDDAESESTEYEIANGVGSSTTGFGADSFVWTFMLAFLASCMASVVLAALKLKLACEVEGNAENIKYVDVATAMNAPIPMLLCIRAVTKYAPSTAFSNQVAAMLIWVAMTKVNEKLALFRDDKQDDSDKLVSLFTMGAWQFFTLLSLYASSDTAQESVNKALVSAQRESSSWMKTIANSLSFVGYAATGVLVAKHAQDAEYRFDSYEYAVISLAMLSFSRALARSVSALVTSTANISSSWFELCGTFMGTMYVLIQIVSAHPHYKRLIPVSEVFPVNVTLVSKQTLQGSLDFPMFAVTHDIFAWSSCVAFMCSAVFFKNHW